MAVQPKCPACEAEGKENFFSTASEQKVTGGLAKFEIVHCGKCGHVYGIFPNFMIPG